MILTDPTDEQESHRVARSNVEPLVFPGRRLPSWVAGFMEFTDSIQSPEIFRRWAAIGTIAGALERKIWVRSQGSPIYPNLYIFLVGPPGSGKTRALNETWNIWKALSNHHVADISLTKAAFIDSLSLASRTVWAPANDTFHSLLIAAPELGALLPSYDAEFMNTLTYLYDCLPYSERRRHEKKDFQPIDKPCVNIIACTTPGFLHDSLPPSAWNQGFLSRVTVVYNAGLDGSKPFDLFDQQPQRNPALESALKHDMIKIGDWGGQLKFTAEAGAMAEALNLEGIQPKPSHPRLTHYNTRRPLQLLKLCIVCAADRGSDYIELYDVQTAHGWMVEVEHYMPDIFAAILHGGDNAIIEDCYHYAIQAAGRTGKDIPVTLVHEFIAARAPAQHVTRIYEVLLSTGRLKSTMAGAAVRPRPL
jgi:hypothetical protein